MVKIKELKRKESGRKRKSLPSTTLGQKNILLSSLKWMERKNLVR